MNEIIFRLKMNEDKLNILSKEKDIEELFKEIEKINKSYSSFNLEKIKEIFIKIKNEYICKYKNKNFFPKEKEKEYFSTIINNISHTTNKW